MALRVLHFSLSDLEGGAARAALRTHQALRGAGVDSTLIVRRRLSHEPSVEEVAPARPWESRRRRALAHVPGLRPRLPEPTATFNFDLRQDFDERSLFDHPRPDVLCLQRITRFLTVRQIRALWEHYTCPLVWVLHDQQPVTGGCHFSYGCLGFTRRCGSCPQLLSTEPDDASRELWQRKHDELRGLPLTFVGQSREAVRWAQESSLFSDHAMHVVPQPVDEEVFRPVDRAGARDRLAVPREARVVLVGAASLMPPRKGGAHAVEALARLDEEAFALVVGEGGSELLAASGRPGRALGVLHDDLSLALLFQAANVFLSPSLADSGPMMVTESLLCGTPVVAFASGLAADLVTPETGLLAAPGDDEGLAQGLRDVLRRGRREDLCRAAALGYGYERGAAEWIALLSSLAG
jgi:glycosyltransferase involved in cell wall biosynthesis